MKMTMVNSGLKGLNLAPWLLMESHVAPHHSHLSYSPTPYPVLIRHPVSTVISPAPNGGPMLGQRRGRWTSIGPALGRCLVFSGAHTSLVVLSEAVDWCICFTRKIQHGGDWERYRTQGSKNVHNFLMTVWPLSWAWGHETEMLLIFKKLFST